MNVDVKESVQLFQNMCVSLSTGGPKDSEYFNLRHALMNDPVCKGRLPLFIRTNRDADQFWHFIKNEAATYAERRRIIWDGFRPLLDHLEAIERSPGDDLVEKLLPELKSEYVTAIWQKALERRGTDPEGALTAARTLLETVCKLILDAEMEAYESDADLPSLYKRTAGLLNLAPSQHTAEVFKRILGGCTSVVEGLGSLRNKLSDAHGQGGAPVRPKPRHAELAVNLAGTMAMFLVSTWRDKKNPA